jgi:hypothetical protein
VREFSNHLEIMEICALNLAETDMRILLNSTSNEEVNSRKKKHLFDNYHIDLLATNTNEGRRKTLILPCRTCKAQESYPIPQITSWFTRDP